MSFQITAAFVQQYAANIYMLAQQRGSHLRPYVRQETIQGNAKAFDTVGSKVARLKTSRHEDTPQSDTPQDKRWCYMHDYDDGDLIDQVDKIRVLNDPTSEYMLAIVWALGRSLDDEIITAAFGTAVSKVDQSGSVTFPNSQYIVANDGSGNSANMNVESLRHAKRLLDAAQIPPEIPRHIACSAAQIYSMLSHTEVTSADYNTVKALSNGELDTYMGFKFHNSERLGTMASTAANFAQGTVGSGANNVSGFRQVIAWAQDGLIGGVGMDITARISERADKCFSVQTYGLMSFGSVRMEEVKVVGILCDETAID